MEIATTTSALHLFPKDQRYKTKGVRYNNLIDFSDVSLLPVIPKIDLDDPQILSRTRRDGREKYDVVAASKKRQHSGEEKPLTKRQKKIIEEVESTTKAKSNRTLTPSLHKLVSESKEETKRKDTKSVDARAITTTKVTKPEKSITASSKECFHETETKKPNGIDLRNLIAKAQDKIQNKRQIDHRRDDITRQRIAARLALNQMVATVSFDDHLNYHRELEQLGYTFIQEEVDYLSMFNLWSRSDYNGITNSVLEKNKTPWSDEDSTRKKHRQSSTKGNSMEQHSLQITRMVNLLRAEIRVIAQQV
ncbi:unnamed protein product [Arabidopsis lyrata]|uniref:Uncharacterized protein n=1 Tax=Arabidopsis lyrata subsp. lyrata TaxID=81972 RepID=D7KGU0_ARALL|nr:uncharacterized protein LOC9330342 isoform X1 [Arabidopsis lyrata subsp. lyrata]EFH70540.1 hypothetical protein ARALYDRAFT_892036 [Arabidopsis lyrata subsp. lyrata]CAH8255222.1 unnamed protein product [Arabidopsis lyrata]|eukprot:XP_002894281.1 uncharacterized protein LOC9330342 isoform X1 [Arabidopsis lyrata subsp. lyrata]